MILKIPDELGVEDKSCKVGLRRSLRVLNGFPPDSLCCFIQTDENISLSSALSLTSLMERKERRHSMQFYKLTCVCFTYYLCLVLI